MTTCLLILASALSLNPAAGLEELSNERSRSISPENFTGEKGGAAKADPAAPHQRNVNNSAWCASELGRGWKVNPCVKIESNETFVVADMAGPGTIRHIWMTPTGSWRHSILRFYWDGETEPSVEVPVADFFCMGWNSYAPINSMMVCVNPGSGFNCYWPMPFRRHCRITMQNVNPDGKDMTLFYSVDYSEGEVSPNAAYFHAQFRRTRRNETSDWTILDGVKGRGHFVGTYMAWETTNGGWWGEGEAKFFIDGDKEFPTICSTGLEDYFCGSYGFNVGGRYTVFTTPYVGMCQFIESKDGSGHAGDRFGLYRWHVPDPVRFERDLKVTMQDLGWKENNLYLAQKSDIASTAFWYQTEPHAKFPPLPAVEVLAITDAKGEAK